MKIQTCKKGEYRLIHIVEPLKLITDLSELKSIIEDFVNKGDKFIAVNFIDASYLYSGAISVLISCYRLVKARSGDLCIVEPNHGLTDLLTQMNIDSIMKIFPSEEDLLTDKPG
jgi:anti-anti-sigma factor